MKYFAESLSLCRELGDNEGIAYGLEGLASAAMLQRRPERAARLFGAAQQLRDDIDAHLPPPDQAGHDLRIGEVRKQFDDEDRFQAAWQTGCQLTVEQAIAEALAG